MRPKAYSYVRFSTPEQAKGDSYRRQLEKAQLYAIRENLQLDDNEIFFDRGVSAFGGSNAIDGQLGAFRRAVEMGDISPGSFLLVENLDRLSRMATWEASTLLGSIVQLGITIVALSDNQVYSRETLSQDPNAMLLMVVGFMRSHQESAYKSQRLASAWASKKALARSSGKPMTSQAPAWLRLTEDRSAFEVINERAMVVRELFSKTLEGVSQTKLASDLNKKSLPTWGKGGRRAKFWHRSYVRKILTSEAVIGSMTPHTVSKVGGKPLRIAMEPMATYYPPIVKAETFEAVQRLLFLAAPPQRGAISKTAPTVSSYFAGLAKCPICDATMTRVNKGRKGGTPYLVCTTAKAGAGCKYQAVKIGVLEESLREHASWLCAQMPSKQLAYDEDAESVQSGIEACDDAIINLLAEIRSGNPSRAVRTDLELVEAERSALKANLEALATRMLASTGRTLVRIAAELEAVLTVPHSGPAQVNVALRALFSRVVVDHQTGQVLFYWRHADETPPAAITYALPIGEVQPS